MTENKCPKCQSTLQGRGFCPKCDQPQPELEYRPKVVPPKVGVPRVATSPKRRTYEPTTVFITPEVDDEPEF